MQIGSLLLILLNKVRISISEKNYMSSKIYPQSISVIGYALTGGLIIIHFVNILLWCELYINYKYGTSYSDSIFFLKYPFFVYFFASVCLSIFWIGFALKPNFNTVGMLFNTLRLLFGAALALILYGLWATLHSDI